MRIQNAFRRLFITAWVPAWLSCWCLYSINFLTKECFGSNTIGCRKLYSSSRLITGDFRRSNTFSSLYVSKVLSRGLFISLNNSPCVNLQTTSSASMNSFVINSPESLAVCWARQLVIKRWIQVIVRTILKYLDCPFMYHSISSCLTDIYISTVTVSFDEVFLFRHTDFLISLSISASFSVSSDEGHWSIKSFSHAGPSHHCDSTRSLAPHPLEGRSAGFMDPATWRHWFGSDNERISFTRFSTNVFYCLFLCIHAKTVIESDQKKTSAS